MKYTYSEIAGMIDHALLHPTLTDAELGDGCECAARYRVASVCIKPYGIKMAVEMLKESGVAVGTVIGFPHGSNATEVKRHETAVACREGATEIDMVINIGKALSGDFGFIEADIRAVCEEAHLQGALVKVILETDFLPDDAIKIRLCEICEKAGADFVKTSTGFGFVKQPDSGYNYKGATAHDLALMRAHVSPMVQVKASGGIRNLDDLILARDLGATRCGTSATAQLLDEFLRRQAEGCLDGPRKGGNLGSGGY